MLKVKAIIAVGVIFLFAGLTLSPATANLASGEEIKLAFLGEDRSLITKTIRLTMEELKELDVIVDKIMDKIESVSDHSELTGTIKDLIRDYGRFPALVSLLQLILKIMNTRHNLNRLRPLRNNAFVVSLGFGNKLIPFRKNQFDFLKPIVLWYYSGRSNILLNSRTTIIDPYPFNVKTLTGRQIGFMRSFAGIYIYRHSGLTDKSYTFFMGRAAGIIGFDLSPNLFNA